MITSMGNERIEYLIQLKTHSRGENKTNFNIKVVIYIDTLNIYLHNI